MPAISILLPDHLIVNNRLSWSDDVNGLGDVSALSQDPTEPRYLELIQLEIPAHAATDTSELRFRFLGSLPDSSGNGDDLSDLWESYEAAVTLRVPGMEDCVMLGPNYPRAGFQDSSEQYFWYGDINRHSIDDNVFYTPVDVNTGMTGWIIDFQEAYALDNTLRVTATFDDGVAFVDHDVDAIPAGYTFSATVATGRRIAIHRIDAVVADFTVAARVAEGVRNSHYRRDAVVSDYTFSDTAVTGKKRGTHRIDAVASAYTFEETVVAGRKRGTIRGDAVVANFNYESLRARLSPKLFHDTIVLVMPVHILNNGGNQLRWRDNLNGLGDVSAFSDPPGESRFLTEFRFRGQNTNRFVDMIARENLTDGNAVGDNLIELWESSPAAITMSAPGLEDLVIVGPTNSLIPNPGDTSEPYRTSLSAAADAGVYTYEPEGVPVLPQRWIDDFVAAYDADNTVRMTLTLSDFHPRVEHEIDATVETYQMSAKVAVGVRYPTHRVWAEPSGYTYSQTGVTGKKRGTHRIDAVVSAHTYSQTAVTGKKRGTHRIDAVVGIYRFSSRDVAGTYRTPFRVDAAIGVYRYSSRDVRGRKRGTHRIDAVVGIYRYSSRDVAGTYKTPVRFDASVAIYRYSSRDVRGKLRGTHRIDAVVGAYRYSSRDVRGRHRFTHRVDAVASIYTYSETEAGGRQRGTHRINASVEIYRYLATDIASFTYAVSKPNAPSGLTIDIDGRVVRFDWTPGAGVLGSPFTYFDISGIGTFQVVDNYLVVTLEPLTTYTVAVVAVNRAGDSDPPLEATFTTGFIPIPDGEFNPFAGITVLPTVDETITNRFPIVGESASVFAVRKALNLVDLVFQNALDLNITKFTAWDTAPIDNIVEWLRAASFPSSNLFGEDFQRLVYRDRTSWFSTRNTMGLLNRFAEAINFSYSVIEWTDVNGFHTEVEICVARRDGEAPTTEWLNALKNWFNWIFNLLVNITLTTCLVERVQLNHSTTSHFHVFRLVEAR